MQLENILSSIGFSDLQEIYRYLRLISVPENWYFYYFIMKWFIGLTVVAYIFAFSLKWPFFQILIHSEHIRTKVKQFNYLLSCCTLFYIVYGIILWIFGQLIVVIFSTIILVLMSAIFVRNRLKNNSLDKNDKDIWEAVAVICLFFLLLSLVLYLISTEYCDNENIIKGYVVADVKSQYRIGDVDTISVKMGGPDTGLAVTLLRDDLNPPQKTSYLKLNSKNLNTQFNNSLVGNVKDAGDYSIVLNTSSLSGGHYMLIFENEKYRWINLRNPFNLLTT